MRCLVHDRSKPPRSAAEVRSIAHRIRLKARLFEAAVIWRAGQSGARSQRLPGGLILRMVRQPRLALALEQTTTWDSPKPLCPRFSWLSSRFSGP